jgi:hypothetical protein
MQEFQQQLQFFFRFFEKNAQFMKEATPLLGVLRQWSQPFRNLNDVSEAKNLRVRGAVFFPLFKKFLKVTLMGQLWSSFNACQKILRDDSEPCLQVKTVVKANTGDRLDLFTSQSDCLSRPSSGTCATEWRQAQQKLEQRLQSTENHFKAIMRRQLRTYFKNWGQDILQQLPTRYQPAAVESSLQQMYQSITTDLQKQRETMIQGVFQLLDAHQLSVLREKMQQQQEEKASLEGRFQAHLQAVEQMVAQARTSPDTDRSAEAKEMQFELWLSTLERQMSELMDDSDALARSVMEHHDSLMSEMKLLMIQTDELHQHLDMSQAEEGRRQLEQKLQQEKQVAKYRRRSADALAVTIFLLLFLALLMAFKPAMDNGPVVT